MLDNLIWVWRQVTSRLVLQTNIAHYIFFFLSNNQSNGELDTDGSQTLEYLINLFDLFIFQELSSTVEFF